MVSCTCNERERESALGLEHTMEDGGSSVGPTGMGPGEKYGCSIKYGSDLLE